MKFLDDGQTVQFTLYDGEIHMLDKKHPENYRRVNFTEQVINVGGVGSELKRTPSNMKTDREMNISEMRETIAKTDSVGAPFVRRIDINVANKLNFLFSDTLDYPAGKEMDDIKALGYLKTDMKSMYTRMKNDAEQINQQNRVIDKYLIEIYKKYSIPAASIAFVLFGAPIAILSRRGGMAMAATISLLVFTVYWAFLIGGEDLGDRGIVSPFVAMWSANFLIGAAGLYLMAKVISEKPLFSFFRR